MSTKKEIDSKKRKFRTFFIVDAIIAGLSLFGFVGSSILFVSQPIPLFSFIFLPILATSLVAGVVGLTKYISKTSRSKYNKKTSLKSIEQISDLTSDKSISMSREDKLKVVRKFAKSNLKQCKLMGGTVAGKLHSVSGMQNQKQTKYFNELENLDLLRQTETTAKGRKKYDKKIAKKKKALSKIAVKTVPQRWTQYYDEFVDGISIYDRRIEVGCFNKTTSEKFQKIANEMVPTDEIGGSVILTFKQQSRVQSTYARVTDVSRLPEVKSLMLNDVLLACEGKPKEEIENMFPVKIETYAIDKKSTKISNPESRMFRSFEDLKQRLTVSQDIEK